MTGTPKLDAKCSKKRRIATRPAVAQHGSKWKGKRLPCTCQTAEFHHEAEAATSNHAYTCEYNTCCHCIPATRCCLNARCAHPCLRQHIKNKTVIDLLHWRQPWLAVAMQMHMLGPATQLLKHYQSRGSCHSSAHKQQLPKSPTATHNRWR